MGDATKKLSDLVVGDVVVVHSRGFSSIPRPCKIDRVMKIHVVVDGQKYSRDRGRLAGDGYGGRIEVPKEGDIEKYTLAVERSRIISRLKSLSLNVWDSMNLDTLRSINAALPEAIRVK